MQESSIKFVYITLSLMRGRGTINKRFWGTKHKT